MTLRTIRLELARTKDFPEGSAGHGYEFIAPLDKSGQLDSDEWQRFRQACTVRRFWRGEDDEHGQLERTLDGTWVFSYELGEADDEPIFRFDSHVFSEGEYVSITEHDGVTRPFRVALNKTPLSLRA